MCEKVEIGLWEEKYERHYYEIIACTDYCSPTIAMFFLKSILIISKTLMIITALRAVINHHLCLPIIDVKALM